MHQHVKISSSGVLTNKFRSSRVRCCANHLCQKIFSRLKLPSTIILIIIFNSDHADELLSGKYLNGSQYTPVKPVEVRNVYDFPFGAKKKGLTPRSIDASENKLKSVLLRSLCCPSYLFDSQDLTLCGPLALARLAQVTVPRCQ
jgi:hypothetical protein